MPTTATRRPIFARFYRRIGPTMERGGLAARRRTLLSGLSGAVVEVGAGDGRNFEHYPAQVDRVLAVEPEPLLRATAATLAARASVPVEVVDGVAERLEVPDAHFDAAVVTLVLCSVRDPRPALRELHRVLRPGGQLRFLEHGRADRPVAVALQRAVDATFWPVFNGGCHTSRQPVAEIAAAGFRIEHAERLGFADTSIPLPVSPLTCGTAVRVGDEEGR